MPSQTVTDTVGTINGLASIWGWLLGAAGEEAFQAGSPSALQLADATNRLLALTADEPTTSAPSGVTAVDTMASLAPLAAASVNVGAGDHEAVAVLNGVTELFHRAGRAIQTTDAAVATRVGRVDQVSASNGGVPKRSIGRAEVTTAGLVEDDQANRRHHGKPMQALCLYSTEVIDALRDEGHPIEPGATGENLTLGGLDWDELRPGVRLRVGTALAEISAPATPCAKNSRWFIDGDHDRMSHDRHPGWSRLYAWVIEPGVVAEGDEVVVEPEGPSG